MSPSKVNTSSPAAQLTAPPCGSPGWNPAQKWVGDPANCGSTASAVSKLWPFGAVWDGGFWAPWESGQGLAPLSVGVCSRGCPVPAAHGQSFRSTQVSHRTGGSLQGGTPTPILSPPLTAGEAPAQPPALTPGPQHPLPWQQEMAPGQPRSGRTRRGLTLTAGRQPRLSGVLGPGNFPSLAGPRILAKPHPEPFPAFRRGGAFAGGLCLGEPARPAGAHGGRAKDPQPTVGAAAVPRTGISCVPPTDPILTGNSRPPSSTKRRWGLLPSPSIPNSGMNLPLHRAKSW